jgi:hypothetical protein
VMISAYPYKRNYFRVCGKCRDVGASLQYVLDVEPNCDDIVPLSVSVVINPLHGGLSSAAKDCFAEVLNMIIELASSSVWSTRSRVGSSALYRSCVARAEREIADSLLQQ